MKIIKKIALFLILPLAAVTLTSAYDNPVGECWGGDGFDVFLPSDTYCNIFYKCNFGTPVRMACASGLHFNAMLNVCDHPTNAGCNGSEDNSGGNGSGGGDHGGQVMKTCFTQFSPNQSDGVYYASCSTMSNGSIVYECGAVSVFIPSWGITLVGTCYQWV